MNEETSKPDVLVLAGMPVSEETVRAYILQEFDVTDEQITEMFEKFGNEMIKHDSEIGAFAYWTGNNIIEKYNQPIFNQLADIYKKRQGFVTDEDQEGMASCDVEASLLRSKLYNALYADEIDEE